MGKKEAGTKKKAFKMPHLLWIMLGLLLIASILTYIIPAGQFATDEAGNVLGDQFNYLGYQTPVNPWQMLMMIVDGFSGSTFAQRGPLVGTRAHDWVRLRVLAQQRSICFFFFLFLLCFPFLIPF